MSTSVAASDLIPILGYREALLGCRDCELRLSCRSPVPYDGPRQAAILLFGEAPGANEDVALVPFIGQAGQELDGYLFRAHLNRDDIRIQNTVNCRPPNNRDPKPAEVMACQQWRDAAIQECDPALIVLLGGIAIQSFFPKLTAGEVHGRALDWVSPWGRVYPVFCTYHPAAALHNGRLRLDLQTDFRNLENYVKGTLEEAKDTYPHPVYERLETDRDVLALANTIRSIKHVSADTEWTPDEKIWCATFCYEPGRAFLVWPQHLPILARALSNPDVSVTLHQAQADLRPLRQMGIIPNPKTLGDTMIMLYVTSATSQGLKEAARRDAGMVMRSYKETVGPYQRAIESWYLEMCMTVDIPTLEAGSRKRTVHQKIRRALNQLEKGEDIDPKSRWDEWEGWETAPLVAALGPYPQASLADVPLEDATYYACRDADATERVRRVREKMMKGWSSFNV